MSESKARVSSGRPLFRLLKQSGLYALGNVAIKFSGLILAPLFLDTKYLTLAEYGQLAVLLVFAQVCIILAGAGFGTGMLKYVGRADNEEESQRMPFTALVITVVIAGITIVLFMLFSPVLATLLIDAAAESAIVSYLGIYIAFKVVSSIPMMLLRIRERAGLYTLAIVLEMIGLIGGVYFFMVIRGEGLIGVVYGYVVAAGLSMTVLVGALLSIVQWSFSWALIRPLFVYGGPLVFMGLAGLVLNAGDRFILKYLTSSEVVGMYEWAARLSGVLNLFVVQSFQLAFTIIGLKSLGSGEERFHRRVFRHYTVWAGWAVLGISLLAYDVTAILQRLGADEHYLQSASLVLPLATGSMMYGAYIVINNILFATEKTYLITWNVILAAICNIFLNFALIPGWGAMGAAVATVLSYGLLTWLSNRVATRTRHIDYSWTAFFTVLGLVFALYWAGQTTQHMEIWGRLTVRAIILALYLPLLFILKIYSVDEVRKAKKIIVGRLRRA